MKLRHSHSLKLDEPEFFYNDAGYVTIESKVFRVNSETTVENLAKFNCGQLLDLRLGQKCLSEDENGSLKFGVCNGFSIHPQFNPREGNGQPDDATLGVTISSKHCVFGPGLLESLEQYKDEISRDICEKPQHAMRIVRYGESKLWIF